AGATAVAGTTPIRAVDSPTSMDRRSSLAAMMSAGPTGQRRAGWGIRMGARPPWETGSCRRRRAPHAGASSPLWGPPAGRPAHRRSGVVRDLAEARDDADLVAADQVGGFQRGDVVLLAGVGAVAQLHAPGDVLLVDHAELGVQCSAGLLVGAGGITPGVDLVL